MDDFNDVELKTELDDISKTIDNIIKKVETYEAEINDAPENDNDQ